MPMREEQVLFMVSGDQVPVQAGVTTVPKYLLLGVSSKAWEYMRGGKNHNFDLRRMGLPTQLIMFGGKTHAHLMDSLSLWTGPVPKIADMHTDNAVPVDEQAMPRMRAAARGWGYEQLSGAMHYPLANLNDEELDDLITTTLQAPGK